jgi:hypothetical protein
MPALKHSANASRIKTLRAAIWRTVYGVRVMNTYTHGFIRMEGKWMRVVKDTDGEWMEHPTDWRSYDTLTIAHQYDEQYDRLPTPSVEGVVNAIRELGGEVTDC